MNTNTSKLACILLLAIAVTLISLRPSGAQAGAQAGEQAGAQAGAQAGGAGGARAGMNREQFGVSQERAEAFCNYYAEQTKQNKPLPAGNLSIPGVGNGKYPFTPSEVQALIKHCPRVMELIKKKRG